MCSATPVPVTTPMNRQAATIQPNKAQIDAAGLLHASPSVKGRAPQSILSRHRVSPEPHRQRCTEANRTALLVAVLIVLVRQGLGLIASLAGFDDWGFFVVVQVAFALVVIVIVRWLRANAYAEVLGAWLDRVLLAGLRVRQRGPRLEFSNAGRVTLHAANTQGAGEIIEDAEQHLKKEQTLIERINVLDSAIHLVGFQAALNSSPLSDGIGARVQHEVATLKQGAARLRALIEQGLLTMYR